VDRSQRKTFLSGAWFEPNLEVVKNRRIDTRACKSLQVVQQIVLPRLTKGQAIDP
jgi:hypothetical protein